MLFKTCMVICISVFYSQVYTQTCDVILNTTICMIGVLLIIMVAYSRDDICKLISLRENWSNLTEIQFLPTVQSTLNQHWWDNERNARTTTFMVGNDTFWFSWMLIELFLGWGYSLKWSLPHYDITQHVIYISMGKCDDRNDMPVSS